MFRCMAKRTFRALTASCKHGQSTLFYIAMVNQDIFYRLNDIGLMRFARILCSTYVYIRMVHCHVIQMYIHYTKIVKYIKYP